MKLIGLIGSIALLATPALAAPWGTDYNMGQFAAGGGSEAEGSLTMQCGDPDAGIADYGELFLQFTLPDGRAYKAKGPVDYLSFSIDGSAIDVPMELEQGSTSVFDYVREAEGSALTQQLVATMRRGQALTILDHGIELATIPLDGASDALDTIDTCIHYRS